MINDDMNILVYCASVACLLIYPAFAEDFFCSENVTDIDLNEGRIFTLYKGQSYYGNNMLCKWKIKAEPDKRIHLTVESSELQYSPQKVLCDGFDHVAVTEGNTFLASWCGNRNPGFVISRGSSILIEFVTDESNPYRHKYKGVQMKFEIFDASECPPGWVQSDVDCFLKRKRKKNWSGAQEQCNFMQANLASIVREEAFDKISDHFEEDERTWIGLNDISDHGKFTWIDNALAVDSFARDLMGVSPHEFKHCIAVNFKTRAVTTEDCDRSNFPFLCKTGKGQPSKIFAVPEESTDKGDEEDSSSSTLLLAIIIPVITIIVLALIIGCCLWHKTNACKKDPGEQYVMADAGHNADPPPIQSSSSRGNVPKCVTVNHPHERSQTSSVPHSSNQMVAPPTYEEAQYDPVLQSNM